ncbi:MAG: hydroxyacid dehydrogenase [Ignavibacteria bacterium]|nr:hydroxyacid dehydrogenase [Ignavibacteria bacterium]
MKILLLFEPEGYWKEQLEKLRLEFPGVTFRVNSGPAERLTELKTANAAICGRLTAEELKESKQLKAVIVPFTGLNNFPVNEIKKRNIALYNTHANAPYVAEHAIALALALLGRVNEFHNDLKQGVWNRTKKEKDMWTTLRGKRCGILGYGHIGRCIAAYLKPFNCKITGFRRNITPAFDDNGVVITNSLEELFQKSDVIFNVLPLNAETKHLINNENIEGLKGKYIISVGRGETIHEEALYNALKDNIAAGAALDVWYKYPGKKTGPVMPANFPFWELPNVLMSPHKSSQTAEAVNAMIDDTCSNIRKFITTNAD